MAKSLKQIAEEINGTNLISCPGCGVFYDPATIDLSKPVNCTVCGVDLRLSKEEAAKHRMSDDEFTKRINDLHGKAKSNLQLAMLLAVGSFAFIWFFAIFLGAAAFIISIPGFFAALYFGLRYGRYGSEAKMLLANNITRGVMNEIFEECIYSAQHGLTEELLKEARLFADWDRVSGSDLVCATYKGHNFSFSDVHLERQSNDDDGMTNYNTKFKGQWMVCELTRELPSMLRLRENFQYKKDGKREKGKSDIETENTAFNDHFQIVTGDPHTAFLILTPHFMEYIVEADAAADARIFMSFVGNHLHILCETMKDSFELDNRETQLDIDRLRARMRGELKYIISIFDELLNNEYLFGKSSENIPAENQV
jgi:hypothetical protein